MQLLPPPTPKLDFARTKLYYSNWWTAPLFDVQWPNRTRAGWNHRH